MTVAARREVAPNYHVLAFAIPDDEPEITASPGQFAMVRGATWGSAPLLPRPMSLLTEGRTPEILIKVVGEGTLRMSRAAVGEPYELLAPLGVPFALPREAKTSVLVLPRGLLQLKAQGPRATWAGRFILRDYEQCCERCIKNIYYPFW